MSANTPAGASRRPLTFYYLGRPASLYNDAMSRRRGRTSLAASAEPLPFAHH
jgi:hypothetical protein